MFVCLTGRRILNTSTLEVFVCNHFWHSHVLPSFQVQPRGPQEDDVPYQRQKLRLLHAHRLLLLLSDPVAHHCQLGALPGLRETAGLSLGGSDPGLGEEFQPTVH